MSPRGNSISHSRLALYKESPGTLSKIALRLLSATSPKLAPAGHVAAIARRNTLPEPLKTGDGVLFPRLPQWHGLQAVEEDGE